MNEKLLEDINALIYRIEKARFSARHDRLLPVKNALGRYEEGIKGSQEDARDYYRRTGALPGRRKSQRPSYAFCAVVGLIEGKTHEEVWDELSQRVEE